MKIENLFSEQENITQGYLLNSEAINRNNPIIIDDLTTLKPNTTINMGMWTESNYIHSFILKIPGIDRDTDKTLFIAFIPFFTFQGVFQNFQVFESIQLKDALPALNKPQWLLIGFNFQLDNSSDTAFNINLNIIQLAISSFNNLELVFNSSHMPNAFVVPVNYDIFMANSDNEGIALKVNLPKF